MQLEAIVIGSNLSRRWASDSQDQEPKPGQVKHSNDTMCTSIPGNCSL